METQCTYTTAHVNTRTTILAVSRPSLADPRSEFGAHMVSAGSGLSGVQGQSPWSGSCGRSLHEAEGFFAFPQPEELANVSVFLQNKNFVGRLCPIASGSASSALAPIRLNIGAPVSFMKFFKYFKYTFLLSATMYIAVPGIKAAFAREFIGHHFRNVNQLIQNVSHINCVVKYGINGITGIVARCLWLAENNHPRQRRATRISTAQPADGACIVVNRQYPSCGSGHRRRRSIHAD